MAELVTAALTFAASLTLLGPGALAPADVGVLEGAQANRLRGCCERNLSRPAPPGYALLAVEDCRYVGWDGLLVVDGIGVYPARVVDCQQREHLACCRLGDRDLVADVNVKQLGHEWARLLLWRE